MPIPRVLNGESFNKILSQTTSKPKKLRVMNSRFKRVYIDYNRLIMSALYEFRQMYTEFLVYVALVVHLIRMTYLTEYYVILN